MNSRLQMKLKLKSKNFFVSTDSTSKHRDPSIHSILLVIHAVEQHTATRGKSKSKKQHEKEKLKLDDVVRISESRLLMEFIIIWKHFSRVLCKSRWINQMENERRRRWKVQSSIWNCFDIIEWICSPPSPVRAPIALHFSSNYTLLSWLKLALFLLWNWTRSLICSVVGGEHTQGNGGWRERKVICAWRYWQAGQERKCQTLTRIDWLCSAASTTTVKSLSINLWQKSEVARDHGISKELAASSGTLQRAIEEWKALHQSIKAS